MYTFPGSKLMGGITKRDETSIRKATVGVLVYLYAENIDDQAEVNDTLRQQAFPIVMPLM